MGLERGELVLIAGGAGFIGSHLCEGDLAEGAEILCIDNFQTGSRQNLRLFAKDPRFDLIEADLAEPFPARLLPRQTVPDHQRSLPGIAAALSGQSTTHSADQRDRYQQPARVGRTK